MNGVALIARDELRLMIRNRVAGCPRPPNRRPASRMSSASNNRAVMLAIVGEVRLVIAAISLRVMSGLRRIT